MSIQIHKEPHVDIRVGNGGFAVVAWVRDTEGNFGYETSIFTDTVTMLGYVKRVTEDLFGSGELVSGEDLGGMTVQ